MNTSSFPKSMPCSRGDICGARRRLKQPHSSADGVRRCCVTLDNSTYLRISCGPAPSVAPGCRGPAAIVTAVSQRTKIPLFQQTLRVSRRSGDSRSPACVHGHCAHLTTNVTPPRVSSRNKGSTRLSNNQPLCAHIVMSFLELLFFFSLRMKLVRCFECIPFAHMCINSGIQWDCKQLQNSGGMLREFTVETRNNFVGQFSPISPDYINPLSLFIFIPAWLTY